MSIFRHRDCPDNSTFIEYVKSQIDWNAAVKSVALPIISPEELLITAITDHTLILDEVNFLYTTLGKVFWRSQDSRDLSGLSLSYNPEHHPTEWKYGSFGHPRYQTYSKYDYFAKPQTDQPFSLKNDYLDSYGFRKILPDIDQSSELYKLLNSFSLPVIRVTARTIDGGYCYPTGNNDGGMHRDDPMCEMIRINVCLSNNGNFGLQYRGEKPIFANPGDVYAINSDAEHRVYVNNINYFKRTHLVIGLSPWLNYDPENDSWMLNEYFGKLHPLEMIKEKLIFKKD